MFLFVLCLACLSGLVIFEGPFGLLYRLYSANNCYGHFSDNKIIDITCLLYIFEQKYQLYEGFRLHF